MTPADPHSDDAGVPSDDAGVPSDNDLAAGRPGWADTLQWNESGLMCAVAQQHDTGEVLMVAWMDPEALHRTLSTGRGTYWSRSRKAYWVKGESSGNVQRVLEVRHDCDADALLLLVDQTGPACHTGTRSCFDISRSIS
jgi:phosphoribosyl-AMP cyclohydrolase